jgi:hypothetical protein
MVESGLRVQGWSAEEVPANYPNSEREVREAEAKAKLAIALVPAPGLKFAVGGLFYFLIVVLGLDLLLPLDCWPILLNWRH